jgi:hypothetical protein
VDAGYTLHARRVTHSEVRPGRAEDKDLGVGARVDARAILLSTIAEVLSFANQKSRLKTMQSIIKVGQRFKFTVLMDDALSERQGVVIRVLSNREEGLGLDVDQYMSYWVEAHELPETEFSTTLVFVRSADEKVYLDGKVTDVTLLP